MHFTDLVVLNRTTEALIDIVVDNDKYSEIDNAFIKNNSMCIDKLKRIVYKL